MAAAMMNERYASKARSSAERIGMTVYVIVQLKMTDRVAYDRYQAQFFDVFKKFDGRLLSADENPAVLEGRWDRDKLVLMSFPDEAAFAPGRIRRNIWKSRKTAKPARKASCCSRRGSRRPVESSGRYHHDPKLKPNTKGAGTL